MGDEHRFVDLKRADYPFEVTYLAEDTGEVLTTVQIDGPGVLEIPSFSPRKVTVVAKFPNRTYRTTSDGNTTEEPA